jgi:plastocyanin
MPWNPLVRPRHTTVRYIAPMGVLALVLACGAMQPAFAALSSVARVVLQKGRHYDPSDLFLHRGDTLTLVNGDDTAVHHAFIEADRFTFDGGDQDPGEDRILKLTEAGDFVIRCGIHPKMRLTVHVQ